MTASEVYHHLHVDQVAYGPEGSDPKVIFSVSVSDEDLNGRKHSVKHVSELRWQDEKTLTLVLNEKRRCRITILGRTYEVECASVQ